MKFNTLFIVIFLSCAPPPPEPIVMPLTKSAVAEPLQETIYTLGYMSEYDIWEFLKGKPSEIEVIETFGFPDSVWLDDEQSTKFLYYYISIIKDYNTIEVSTTTDSVSGFEWD